MKKVLFTFALIALHFVSFGRNSAVDLSKPQSNRIQARTGDCSQGSAQIDLDINNIRARLLNTGDLWWDRNAAKYGAPKLTNEQIAKGERQPNPIFAGALWLSGLNSGGQLRIAAVTYSVGGTDFFPGPMANNISTITKDQCNKFNRFFEVKGADIKKFIADPNLMTESIKFWPGIRNPNMPSLPGSGFTANDFNDQMAPFYDKNGDGDYNPADGDYPAIKYVNGLLPGNTEGAIADQMIFWVLNDIGNAHTGSNGIEIGIQLNCLAFSFLSSNELNSMTFYRYDIVKKSTGSISQCYISQFVDTDMGDYTDDYVGCTPSRDLGYCINADAFDATTSVPGYGEKIPIIGVDFFEGAIGLNGLPNKMTAFNYFINEQNAPNSDPGTAAQFRNYQEGKNRTGGIFTEGGNCLGGTTPTNFCFPGNPANVNEWSMCSASMPQRDVRFVQHSGQFNLGAGDHQYVSIGVIFVQPPAGSYKGCQIDVEEHLYKADDLAQSLFDNNFKSIKGPDAPDLDIIEENNLLVFNLNNPKSSNNFGEAFSQKLPPIPSVFNLIDSTYKFEGYMIYQLSSPSVASLADLKNTSLARLVKIMDIKNGFRKTVFNTTQVKDPNNPNSLIWKPIDYETVVLPNEGITKTFTVTQDLFELEGRKNLVNNKSYYYAVVAFAINNYQNPGTPSTSFVRNNQTPLLFSSTIKVYSAIPHNSSASGFKLNTQFNEFLEVKRNSGRGHGSYFLELADSQENKIIEAPYALDVLKYKPGKSPVAVYVNNPYKVIGADFKLTISDTTNIKSNKVNLEKGFWELEVDGNIIKSEKNISRPFDQQVQTEINGVLKEYGISVGIDVADSIGVVARNKRGHYAMIDADVIYSDPKNEWLQFLKNEDKSPYSSWIRTGNFDDQSTGKYSSALNIVNGVKVFNDPKSNYGKIFDSRIAPYCLTSNNAIENAPDPLNNYASYGPGFKWKALTNHFNRSLTVAEGPENNLDSLFSVDLVITPDKSKWSQCIVLETGETPEFHEFNALKGQIRKAPSVDKDQNQISGDFGRSYFPGYAINLETGQRVNVYFGENSRLTGKGGANMWWDPTDKTITALTSPILGGSHFVYITNSLYDGGETDQKVMLANFNKDRNNADVNLTLLNQSNNTTELNPKVAAIFKTFAWTFIPHMKENLSLYDKDGVYKIPSEIRMKIRVQAPYAYYLDNSKLEYEFSTKGLAPTKGDKELIKAAFEEMTIVPNPYNAYSVYEASVSQNTIKIINVPKKAKISIFTTDGILVRTLKQSLDENVDLFYGANQTTGERNLDNSISWDLRTNSGVLISSGVYYINVESPEYGSKVLKLFATMRSADVSNF